MQRRRYVKVRGEIRVMLLQTKGCRQHQKPGEACAALFLTALRRNNLADSLILDFTSP